MWQTAKGQRSCPTDHTAIGVDLRPPAKPDGLPPPCSFHRWFLQRQGHRVQRESVLAGAGAFARALLTHTSPYTHRRYADEPALAWLSLINEGNFE